MRFGPIALSIVIGTFLTACLVQAAAFVPPWCAAGSNTVALSSDGLWILAADTAPGSFTLYDRALQPVRRYTAATLDGKAVSTLISVHNAPLRRSFVVPLKGIAELWEISYDAQAEPIFDGLVHDYRMGEGVAKPGYFGVRRTKMPWPWTDLYFTDDGRSVVAMSESHTPAAAAAAEKGLAIASSTSVIKARVINLDIRREMDAVVLPAKPNPATDLVVVASGDKRFHATPANRQTVAAHAELQRYCTP